MAYTQITAGAAFALSQVGYRATLPKWRLALANVFSGTADAKVLFVGDSTTSGEGPNTTPRIAATATTRLTTLLNARYGAPAAQGLGVPPTQAGSGPDSRWTIAGTGWADNSPFGFASVSNYKATSSTTGTLTYTPSGGANYDSFIVYFLKSAGNGLGTVRALATGGTNTDINTGTGADGIGVGTVTGTAGTSNTIQFTHLSGSDVYIVGVEPFHSSTVRVRVANAGLGGTDTGNWKGNSVFGSLACIQAYTPNLTVINLGINDAIQSFSTSTYSTNLQAIITAAQVSGDVILQTMYPSANATYNGFEAQYVTVMRGLGVSLNIPLIDYWAISGGVNPSSFDSGDGLHPSILGYWDMASAMYPLIAI